jgi:hypothetical protein
MIKSLSFFHLPLDPSRDWVLIGVVHAIRDLSIQILSHNIRDPRYRQNFCNRFGEV